MLGPIFPILGRLLPAPVSTPVLPLDDDPATLARLAAVMSDRVRTCQSCGRDAHVCRAIGCDVDDAPLLLPQTTVDRSEDLDEDAPLIYGLIVHTEPELVA